MISSSSRRTRTDPERTSPSCVTSRRETASASTAWASSPPGARLLPLVAVEAAAPDRLELGLGLAGGVGAEHREVLAGPQVGGADDRLVPRGDGHHHVLGDGLLAAPGPPAELVRQRLGDLGPRVVADAGLVAGRGQAARRPCAVDAAADDAGGLRVLAGQGLRRDRGRAARPQGGDRRALDQGELLARRGVGDQDRAADDRQAPRAVAGERGDPLEDRQAVAAGGHRPEVAAGRRLDVDLRRHLPLARGVPLERVAGALDRGRGVDRLEHGRAGDDGNRVMEPDPERRTQADGQDRRAAKYPKPDQV